MPGPKSYNIGAMSTFLEELGVTLKVEMYLPCSIVVNLEFPCGFDDPFVMPLPAFRAALLRFERLALGI